MNNKTIGSISVDVKCNLKIDDDTAMACLLLLEQYCRTENKKIEVEYGRKLDEEENHIILNFADDNDPIKNPAINAPKNHCAKLISDKA